MILSKTNLQSIGIVKDTQIQVLDNLHITTAGDTIAINGSPMTILCTSAVREEIKENILIENIPIDKPITVPSGIIRNVLKDMPSDKLFKGLREHCDVSIQNTKLDIKYKDGRDTKVTQGTAYKHEYADYRELLSEILNMKTRTIKITANLKTLVDILNTIIKMCPDGSGVNPVFLEFTAGDDIIIRTTNQQNGQKVLGIVKAYKNGGEVVDKEWEKNPVKQEPR